MSSDNLRKRAFLRSAFHEAMDLGCGDVAACILRMYLREIFGRRVSPSEQRLIEADLHHCVDYSITLADRHGQINLPFDSAERAIEVMFGLQQDDQRKELGQLVYALTQGM